MTIVEMKADTGARVEVRRTISGNFSNMHFPDAKSPDYCYPSGCAFVSSDEAITAAALWIAARHTQERAAPVAPTMRAWASTDQYRITRRWESGFDRADY